MFAKVPPAAASISGVILKSSVTGLLKEPSVAPDGSLASSCTTSASSVEPVAVPGGAGMPRAVSVCTAAADCAGVVAGGSTTVTATVTDSLDAPGGITTVRFAAG